MTRATDFERRLRSALEAEAALTRPHAGAWAENTRRLRGSGRRRWFRARLLAIPATVAATAAVILVAFTIQPEPVAHRPPGPPVPRYAAASALPSDLDPRYGPAGPSVVSTDGSMVWWFAGHGARTLLCWRLTTGGGDCRGWTVSGRHAAFVGVADLPPVAASSRSRRVMVYGVTDGQSGPVTLALANGRRYRAAELDRPGPPRRIWWLTFPRDDQVPVAVTLRNAVLADSQGPLPSGVGGPRSTVVSPRPLTAGVPAFTYRTASGPVTMHVFVDGDSLQLGHTGDVPAQPGRGKYFGSVRKVSKGIDAPWVFGFLSPQMARVVLRLASGRTVPAKISPIGRYRVFVAQLVDERPDGRDQRDMILTYDAAGKPLANWRA